MRPIAKRVALAACLLSVGCDVALDGDDVGDGDSDAGGDVRPVDGDRPSIVVEELGWEQIAEYDPGGAIAAKLNPVDGAIYYGGRTSDTSRRGLWRIPAGGVPVRVGGTTQIGGVAVDPVAGDVFAGDDFRGNIFRFARGTGAPTTWVSGFQGGDDDPVGIGVAPQDYTGALIGPGEMVVVDRGNGGPDHVWAFSPATPQGERLIHSDNGTLLDGVDVAISRTDIYVADQGRNRIYRLLPTGSLEAVATDTPLRPSSIAVDPTTQELLVVDLDTSSVVRLDPTTGATSLLFSGLAVNTDNWNSLDVSPDGTRVLITERGTASNGTITLFELPDNFRPVARCQDVVREIGAFDCVADADVDAGSFDPEDGAVAIALSPEGPYPVGDTEVTLTATDSQGKAGTCTATVSVVSESTAWIASNAVSDPALHRGFNDHSLLIWAFFGGGTATLDADDLAFEAANDGSWARLFGSLRVRFDGAYGVNNDEQWFADVSFAPPSLGFEPRRELNDPDVNQPTEVTDTWRFYEIAGGSTLAPTDDASLATLTPLPIGLQNGFQLGDTASGRNANFGLSGWLLYRHNFADGTALRGFGHFNVDLTPVCDEIGPLPQGQAELDATTGGL